MAKKNKVYEEKAHLASFLQGCAHDPFIVAIIFVENGKESHAEFKYAKDQRRILDAMEEKIKCGE